MVKVEEMRSNRFGNNKLIILNIRCNRKGLGRRIKGSHEIQNYMNDLNSPAGLANTR